MNLNKLSIPVAVATTDTLVDVVVESFQEGVFTIKNNTANALDAFEVHARMSKTGPLVLLNSAALDYSTPVYPVRRGSALASLAGNTSGFLFLNLNGIHSLVFKASSAVGVTTVDINGQCN